MDAEFNVFRIQVGRLLRDSSIEIVFRDNLKGIKRGSWRAMIWNTEATSEERSRTVATGASSTATKSNRRANKFFGFAETQKIFDGFAQSRDGANNVDRRRETGAPSDASLLDNCFDKVHTRFAHLAVFVFDTSSLRRVANIS